MTVVDGQVQDPKPPLYRFTGRKVDRIIYSGSDPGLYWVWNGRTWRIYRVFSGRKGRK